MVYASDDQTGICENDIGANLWARSLRGSKYAYCEGTTAVHFSDFFRYVIPLCASKDRKTVLAVAPSRYGYCYRADSWQGTGLHCILLLTVYVRSLVKGS